MHNKKFYHQRGRYSTTLETAYTVYSAYIAFTAHSVYSVDYTVSTELGQKGYLALIPHRMENLQCKRPKIKKARSVETP